MRDSRTQGLLLTFVASLAILDQVGRQVLFVQYLARVFSGLSAKTSALSMPSAKLGKYL